MAELSDAEIESEAYALLDHLGPKRRPRPRLAPALMAAELIEVETPAGLIASWRLGHGPALLLVHGWNDDNCLWAPLIDKALAYRRAVVVLDLPGHGFSKAPDVSIPLAAQAILAVGQHHGPIESIVAHSFGCAASILALDLGLNLKSAVMIGGGLPQAARRHIEKLSERGVPQEILDRAISLHEARARAEGRDISAFDLMPYLGRRSERALIVHAYDDEQCPVDDARTVKAAWPGAQLSLHDDLGHRGIAQDDAVLDIIIDFIEMA